MRALLIAAGPILLALAGCSTAPAGMSRDCTFARPLILSHQSIAGLDDDDAKALLAFNLTARAVCGAD